MPQVWGQIYPVGAEDTAGFTRWMPRGCGEVHLVKKPKITSDLPGGWRRCGRVYSVHAEEMTRFVGWMPKTWPLYPVNARDVTNSTWLVKADAIARFTRWMVKMWSDLPGPCRRDGQTRLMDADLMAWYNRRMPNMWLFPPGRSRRYRHVYPADDAEDRAKFTRSKPNG